VGYNLTVNWSSPCTYNAGSLTVTPTYSPVGAQVKSAPNSGNGTSSWSYVLDTNDRIRNGDTVAISIPASFAEDALGAGNAAYNANLDNSSQQPYDPTSFDSAKIAASGLAASITFSDRVSIDASDFESNVKILARDKSSGNIRVFTPVPGSWSYSTSVVTNDTINFDLTGAGTIHKENGAGAPLDGDETYIHSNNSSGIVDLWISVQSGYPVGVIAVGSPTTLTDYTNSESATNQSTVIEVSSATTLHTSEQMFMSPVIFSF
jgi:hypothetical protein